MKKVSVIIPAYNAEKYLEECLNSLISQTYGNIEIIVVDDGSGDRTQQILQTYGSIKTVRQSRKGVANARNTGMLEASGDYIMFVDSDDFVDADAVETLVGLLEKYNADIVHFSLRYINENGECSNEKFICAGEKFIEKKEFKNEIFIKMMSGIQFNSVCRNFYKRKITEGLLFKTDMSTAEDLLFNTEAFTKAENCLFTDTVRYNYRRTGSSLTGNSLDLKEKYKCNKIVSEKMKEKLKLWDMDNIYYRCVLSLRQACITASKAVRILKKR